MGSKLTVALLGLLLTLGVAAALTTEYHQNVNVNAITNYELTINGIPTSPEATIDWGSVGPGTYTKTINVTNIGTVSLTITISAPDLQEGWIETWTANNTVIEPTQSAVAALTLTIPQGTLAGPYAFTLIVNAEKVVTP